MLKEKREKGKMYYINIFLFKFFKKSKLFFLKKYKRKIIFILIFFKSLN
jgi:hypothetical protein